MASIGQGGQGTGSGARTRRDLAAFVTYVRKISIFRKMPKGGGEKEEEEGVSRVAGSGSPRSYAKQQGRILEILPCCFGAENGIRTRDPQLGKLMLYRLSYFRIRRTKILRFFRLSKTSDTEIFLNRRFFSVTRGSSGSSAPCPRAYIDSRGGRGSAPPPCSGLPSACC